MGNGRDYLSTAAQQLDEDEDARHDRVEHYTQHMDMQGRSSQEAEEQYNAGPDNANRSDQQ